MKSLLVGLFALSFSAIANGEVEMVRMETAPNMIRADLYYQTPLSTPKAVLVLCPGANGEGKDLIEAAAWMDFAKQNQLGLVGLSFASTVTAIHDGSGYYYASKGSGQKLLDGIKKIYHKDLPILVYGFSGGAHFTSRFEEWMPQRVIAWCADSAGWWDVPVKSNFSPPGIVACGDKDPRYGASLTYFKQGRASAKPWLWVSLGGIGHAGSPKLDDFVRSYFASVLDSNAKKSAFVDIDLKTVLQSPEAQASPSLTGWLPSDTLLASWRIIHEP